MKTLKLIIIGAFSITLLIFSCKKNSSNQNTAVTIVGKWYYISDTVRQSTNGGPFTIVTTKTNYSGEYWQFNSDGSGSNYYNSTTSNYTYKTSHDTLTVFFPSVTTGNTVVPQHSQVLIIKFISSNNLSLFSDQQMVTPNGNGEVTDNAYFTR